MGAIEHRSRDGDTIAGRPRDGVGFGVHRSAQLDTLSTRDPLTRAALAMRFARCRSVVAGGEYSVVAQQYGTNLAS
jgi:hypothetical protein